MPGPKLDIGGSLRRHWLLSAIAAALVIAAGLPVAWVMGKARYSTTAVVFVSPRFLANLEDSRELDLQSNSQYRDYVQQNVRTINRFDIVLEGLKRAGKNQSVWVLPGESLERSAERLQGALAIQQVPDTYQIAVTLETDKQAGLAELVNSVVNTYLEKVKTEEVFASGERIQNLLQERNRLQQEIDEKQARRLSVAQEIGVSTFTENYINPFDRLLVTTKEGFIEAQKDRIAADAALGEFDDKQRSGGTDALRAYALDQAGKDPAMTSLLTNLNARRVQILTSMSGLLPANPRRAAAERELAEIEKQRQETFQKLVDSYSKMLLDKRQSEAYKAARVEEKLKAEIDRQTSQASWFTRNYQDGIQMGLDIDRARKRYDTIQQRLDFLSLERNAPGFIRLFTAARVPDMPSKGGRRKLAGLVAAAAFFLALFLPIGVDLLDPRIHSPRDLHSVLGFAPIGWLLEKRDAGPEFAREQILRLANRISQERQNNGSRIFAFTSVKARGGTSTIVTEAAQALTRLGAPALAVEANAYRADPRYRKPDSRGLTVLLMGGHDLPSAVLPADDEMPDRIPVGDLSNEKNLPDIENLIEILRQAAQTYSVVLVDLPPILVSVDAEYIARTADVVVLVVEAESVTKVELQRAAASLERLRVSAVSAILNRVRADAAAGFGKAALDEFRTGAPARRRGPLTRWLWK